MNVVALPNVVAAARTEDAAPPSNIEAEQALLGSILMSADLLSAVARFLRPDHFFEALHQKIYATALDLQGRAIPPTIITLKDFLPYGMVIGDTTLGSYMARLAGAAVGPAAGEGLARLVMDLALRRDLVELGGDVRSTALQADAGTSGASLIETAIARLSALSATGLRPALRQSTAGAAAASLMADIESDTPSDPPVSTGLGAVDRLIGGYRRGTLLILAGRPGMGKTSLAGSSALKVAAAGHGVLFFSKEMTKEQLVARLLTDLAFRHTEPILYEQILNRERFDEERRTMLRDAVRRLSDLPLIIDPQPGGTIAELGARAGRTREAMDRRGIRLGLIICDHLGKIALPRDGRRNMSNDLGDVTDAAATLAKEADACFMMLCQLNRKVEERTDKRPMLSDLRDSGEIEEDADVVIGLYREAYYLARTEKGDDAATEVRRQDRLHEVAHDLDALVLKNRHGADGSAKLWMHPGAAVIADREWQP